MRSACRRREARRREARLWSREPPSRAFGTPPAKVQLLGDEVSVLFQGKEASGDLLQALLQKLLPRIDAMIRQMIQQWRISNPHNPTLSSSQQSQVVSGVVSSLRGQIEASTNSFLAQSPNTIQDSAVVEAIIGQYQPTIISRQ